MLDQPPPEPPPSRARRSCAQKNWRRRQAEGKVVAPVEVGAEILQ
jgi:hypothetical protein